MEIWPVDNTSCIEGICLSLFTATQARSRPCRDYQARIHYGSQDTTGAVYRSKSKNVQVLNAGERHLNLLSFHKAKGSSAQVPEVPRSCSRVKRYVLLAHVSTQCTLTVTR